MFWSVNGDINVLLHKVGCFVERASGVLKEQVVCWKSKWCELPPALKGDEIESSIIMCCKYGLCCGICEVARYMLWIPSAAQITLASYQGMCGGKAPGIHVHCLCMHVIIAQINLIYVGREGDDVSYNDKKRIWHTYSARVKLYTQSCTMGILAYAIDSNVCE